MQYHTAIIFILILMASMISGCLDNIDSTDDQTNLNKTEYEKIIATFGINPDGSFSSSTCDIDKLTADGALDKYLYKNGGFVKGYGYSLYPDSSSKKIAVIVLVGEQYRENLTEEDLAEFKEVTGILENYAAEWQKGSLPVVFKIEIIKMY
ncbi:hypothetical protein MmiEs2_08330 [Methanimicrococcus stummii]|uniref:Uncharacterized protein n=2 Tax=Methanimicrococcus stummii TaxID=3028294 RepID=A0AA96V998_9EURY|nr:hypothetical protein MmiEs2_08330 [Methanimicrococcus sp. Es2]